MVRRRGKRVKSNLYGVNVSRLSVYPQARIPEEGRRPPKPGSRIRVHIASVDEEGRGVGSYMGYRVVVDGGEPGESVEAVVTRVSGSTIYARAQGQGEES